MDDAEAGAQRRRQQPGARRRADERERLQRHLDRPRARPLADHDVELVVLHRGIEDLLDRRRHAVDFVDEEHVARLQVGQHRREIAGLLDAPGPAVGADRHAQLVGDHVGERRLAEAGRTVEQHVIERLAALLRGRDRDVQVLADAVLPDVVVERRAGAAPPRTGRPRRTRAAVTRRSSHQFTCASARRSACAQRLLEGAGVGRCSDRVDGLFRSGTLIAEVDQRRQQIVAQRRRRPARAPSGCRRVVGFGSRSFSSSPMRSAVFLPTPGIAVSRATSLRRDRPHQLRGSMPESTASASFGPMPLTAISRSNRSLLERRREPEERERVLAHVRVDAQRDRRARLAERVERGQRHLHVVADAADVDDRRGSGASRASVPRRRAIMPRSRSSLAATVAVRQLRGRCRARCGAAARSRDRARARCARGRWPPPARRRRRAASAPRRARAAA